MTPRPQRTVTVTGAVTANEHGRIVIMLDEITDTPREPHPGRRVTMTWREPMSSGEYLYSMIDKERTHPWETLPIEQRAYYGIVAAKLRDYSDLPPF